MSGAWLAVSAGNERDVFSGGLFLVRDGAVDTVDLLPTAGLCAGGGRFYRIASQRQHDGAELLVYDERGIARYLRVDGVADPHDILVRADGTVVCVSPSANAIVELAPDGGTRPLWSAPAPFDAWHVNCVTEHEGRLFATAFGRFERYRGWNDGCTGTGVLFDVESGADVVSGLTQPHTPRWIDGAWTVCDSGAGAVVRVAPGGEPRRIELGGFPRGLCALGERVYVGISELRGPDGLAGTASIAVLDRATWDPLERIPMPGGNPYDIVAVGEATAQALRIGFGFCSRRRRNLDQLAMFEAVGVTPARLWAVGEPLATADRRVSVWADVPARMELGEAVAVPCRVASRSGALLVSAPPCPVSLSYRWLDAAGTALAGTALRTPLPAALPPGAALELVMMVGTPRVPGTHTLVVTAFQAGGGWFDEADPGSAYRVAVVVGGGRLG